MASNRTEYSPDTLRILITTDNHVGYNEADPVRGDDSWTTFEEIMQIARDEQVDMVLCAGDLFHINKPSKKSFYEVIRILRKYTLGDKPVEMQVLYDGPLAKSAKYADEFATVNYEDPNLNVAIPFFAISGNHDDASGTSMLSAMDVLSATGLVNYFGKVNENDNLQIDPIVIQKGSTKVSLYGFDSVRDERLFRTFRAGNVKFSRPSDNQDRFFNLIAVHQNHAARTDTGYLREDFIPDFMHFVVWGHEHDCHIDPVFNAIQGFNVLQPGSSVATSLAEGEALPKHVAILNVTNKSFSLDKIRLKTVRPFAFEQVKISDSGINLNSGDETRDKVTHWMIRKVEMLIKKVQDEWSELHPELDLETDFPLPLIRLRVEHTGEVPLEHPLRFSSRFTGRVANITDIVQYSVKRVYVGRPQRVRGARGIDSQKGFSEENLSVDDFVLSDDEMMGPVKVQELVQEELDKEHLETLPPKDLSEVIQRYIEKDDRAILKKFVEHTMEETVDKLKNTESMTTEQLLEKLHLTETTSTTATGTITKKATVKKPAAKSARATKTTKTAASKSRATGKANSKTTRAKKSKEVVSEDELLEMSDDAVIISDVSSSDNMVLDDDSDDDDDDDDDDDAGVDEFNNLDEEDEDDDDDDDDSEKYNPPAGARKIRRPKDTADSVSAPSAKGRAKRTTNSVTNSKPTRAEPPRGARGARGATRGATTRGRGRGRAALI